ncbi:hypothetical protein [Nocardia sp. NPDC004860]|uniref:hypothetical protein n=1 Tax=Nocardia sp. NPDC004860 TaxID=3154557 RepID=UPI0033A1F469
MNTIRTNWRGHAIKGPWFGDYYLTWIEANNRSKVEPGCWCTDEHGRDWWVTDTPEWDRQWFRSQGVKPPQRFGDRAQTEWIDQGEGLRLLGYTTAPQTRRWPWSPKAAA